MPCELCGTEEMGNDPRGNARFCPKHRQVHYQNKNLIKKHDPSKIATCKEPDCYRMFVDKGYTEGYCHTCAKRKGIRSKSYQRKWKADGRKEHDFMTFICKKDGEDCADFIECSNTVFNKKKDQLSGFKYRLNGGVDCYQKPKYVERVSYGCALAREV